MAFTFSLCYEGVKDYPFPTKETCEAVGYDMPTFVPFGKKIVLQPGTFVKLPTNITLNLSPGYYASIAARSSTMHTLHVFPENIHSDYKDEIFIGVRNVSLRPIEINHRECVAQLIFHKLPFLVDFTARSKDEKQVTRVRKGSTDTK